MTHENKITIILAIALICVSTASIFARWLDSVPAVTIAAWRMVLGSVFLWMISIVHPQPKLDRKHRLLTAVSGIFLGLHFLFFFTALKLTSIANATFLATLAPLFTILIEKIVFKKKLIPGLLPGLGFAFLGMFVILGGKLEFEPGQVKGNLLAVISSFWISITYLLTENIRRSTGTLTYSRSLYFWAAVLLFLVGIIFRIPVFSVSGHDFTGLVLIGLVPTVFGHSLLYFALRFVPPGIVASVPLGEPVIASVLAIIIFNEFPDIMVCAGGAFVLGGLYKVVRCKSNIINPGNVIKGEEAPGEGLLYEEDN